MSQKQSHIQTWQSTVRILVSSFEPISRGRLLYWTCYKDCTINDREANDVICILKLLKLPKVYPNGQWCGCGYPGRGKKNTKRVFPYLLRLGGQSYPVPILVGISRYLSRKSNGNCNNNKQASKLRSFWVF